LDDAVLVGVRGLAADALAHLAFGECDTPNGCEAPRLCHPHALGYFTRHGLQVIDNPHHGQERCADDDERTEQRLLFLGHEVLLSGTTVESVVGAGGAVVRGHCDGGADDAEAT
jgi:hypothetical protein